LTHLFSQKTLWSKLLTPCHNSSIGRIQTTATSSFIINVFHFS
jgi:hypothetical protein